MDTASLTTRTLSIPTPDGAVLHATEYTPNSPLAPDAPTVVLAHGWILSSENWAPVVREVLSHRAVRAITYDQRGHGRSTWGSSAPSIPLLGDDLATVIAAVSPTGPLVLGGHSMGGMTVLAYAGQRADVVRDRVRGVALVATAHDVSDRRNVRAEAAAMAVAARIPLLRTGMVVPGAILTRLNFGENPPAEGVHEAGRQMSRASLQAFGRYFPAIRDLDEARALEVLAEVPTHVVVGAKDRITPARWSRALHAGIRDSRLTVLPGRGHMLNYEATDVVADALIELVDGS
ncbi:alpha/beta fold hydrolase [Knoellia subterranea]|uniref:AB hydrolase-1 domain-containing protein n=1 Tax=Knoellia subterranea KCTC 19937 TaxID=1385521 RepID=A0A0A0JPI7_9MICO|nr:alpha/beta hydrolase [Knoellia subterranea]KGN37962.1 hypothetical protein N803_12940 [Knoellia subterranea KCTC 19937]